MPHEWTPAAIGAYHKQRDARRHIHGLAPWHTLAPAAQRDSRDAERTRVLKDALSAATTQAWSLDTFPASATCPAPRDGALVLPAAYAGGSAPARVRPTGPAAPHMRSHSAQIPVLAGESLSACMYAHYQERVDPATYRGSNFVSDDHIRARRSDYLGPHPCVAGFQVHGGGTRAPEYHVEWVDRYLDHLWIDGGRWTVAVVYEEAVDGWVVVARDR
jgi:hypothetical protein